MASCCTIGDQDFRRHQRATESDLRRGREREMTVSVSEQPDGTKSAKVERTATDYALSGLAVEDLDPVIAEELGLCAKRRIVVTKVEPDSGAEKAGLMLGDIIREVNRQPVKSMKDFEKVPADMKKRDNVLILINRQGNALFLSAKI